jgi:hypothetical protein
MRLHRLVLDKHYPQTLLPPMGKPSFSYVLSHSHFHILRGHSKWIFLLDKGNPISEIK